MDLHRYLAALRKSWWIVIIAVLAGGAGAYLWSARMTKIYAAHVDFYVSTHLTDVQSVSGVDQFAQSRATTYAELASSDRLAGMVRQSTGLAMSPRAIAHEVSGTAHLSTVIVTTTVRDPSPRRALTIASALTRQFPAMVDALDNPMSPDAEVHLEVVSGPIVGSAPVSPRTNLNVALGIALGLAAGIALALLRELLDVSVRTADDATGATGTRLLGTIPVDSGAREHPLVVDEWRHTPRAEAMRRLRTNVRFIDAVQPFKVIAVTSALPNEGKSLTAVNLALVLAESGGRTVLVDADLRRPSVARYLGIEGTVGLTTVLAGMIPLDEALQSVGERQLEVLTAGQIPPNPSELLGSPAMGQLVAALRARADYIVFDTPPALPLADAAVLGGAVDGTLLVMRCGRTKRAHAASAAHALRAAEGRFVGAVLNMSPLRRGDDRGYGYTYGPDEQVDRTRPQRLTGLLARVPRRRRGTHAPTPVGTATR
ncbi:MAG TPA: polysaccharide biosynthesis tyrosine autokinase [Jatrophihabitans sp.]|nr:polysaccharide biosynthesis tyrosine autokinase [Jatrophihabitans sp.]